MRTLVDWGFSVAVVVSCGDTICSWRHVVVEYVMVSTLGRRPKQPDESPTLFCHPEGELHYIRGKGRADLFPAQRGSVLGFCIGISSRPKCPEAMISPGYLKVLDVAGGPTPRQREHGGAGARSSTT